MSLADNKCIPCRGGVPPVSVDRAQALLKELGRGWSLNQAGHLERLYTFNDFAKALAYVNKVGGRGGSRRTPSRLLSGLG